MRFRILMNSRWLAMVCLAVVVITLAACSSGGDAPQPVPDPLPPAGYVYSKPMDIGDGWQTAGAALEGMSVDTLEDLINAMPGEFPIVDSIAIARRGKLVLHETLRETLNEFDDWVDNTDPDMHVMFSASKSLASLAVGIAIDNGVITGLLQPWLALFPYTDYANWDERKAAITLEDILTMRHGLVWNEWDPPYSSPDNQMLRFYADETDYSKAFFDQPMAHDPGTQFAYSTPASVSIGQAIENHAPTALIDFGFAHVFAPLSISNVEVFTTPTGLPDLGRGLYLKTRDFLKFGQLYLARGTWNGERIVSESWIDASVHSHVPLSWTRPEDFDWQVSGYGYQWWTGYFEHGGERFDSYAARGHGQQVLMVIPELDLVVAVFSHAFDASDDEVNQVFRLINRYVIEAVL